MIILPAIDIKGGNASASRKAIMIRKPFISEFSPPLRRRHGKKQGAEFIHLVDLDGAKAGRPGKSENNPRYMFKN
jgi:phosphoribosylformimino-5-aminoimidazole carboxamide ribotide isomerase